jgi:dihydrofolate synthase/folylpolyglutamate synthase
VRFNQLTDWLAWQETLHPSAIDLGLERPGQVLKALGLQAPSHRIITVAGTNGKGSSVAMLEAMLLAAGYRVGSYTSPHLLHYNERIRLNGQPVADAPICDAFARIDAARGETSLTYFEFGTLAAFLIFAEAKLDVVILEVGLGGRLDAVNLLDADVALITAIDIDHAAWLGDSRELIAIEKAGIMRAQRPAVCSDPHPPQSLLEHAAAQQTPLFCLERDYQYRPQQDGWLYTDGEGTLAGLPRPALVGEMQLQNAAGVIRALRCLADKLPLSTQAIRQGLLSVSLPGRMQRLPGEPMVLLDVAHNPQSARVLAHNLAAMPCAGRTLAVLGMLADKDISSVIVALSAQVDHWYLAGLDVWRGADAGVLAQALAGEGIAAYTAHTSVEQALAAAQADAAKADRIIVFGSFHTVAEALVKLTVQAG